MTPRKGQDVLVRALARLAGVEWTCILAGSLIRDPDFADRVRREIRGAGLDGRVLLAGECNDDELERLYGRASIFVLPSHYEGYGMVLSEALVRGLPVVSTTGGAIPSTVPPGAGVLVPPGDVGALAEVLAPLLGSVPGDPLSGGSPLERRLELSRAALAHAATLPGWERTVLDFARAVVELAVKPGPVPAPTGQTSP